MSVAFVKEPNDDQVEVLPDRDLGTEPNLVTPRGLALIDAEIAALKKAAANPLDVALPLITESMTGTYCCAPGTSFNASSIPFRSSTVCSRSVSY